MDWFLKFTQTPLESRIKILKRLKPKQIYNYIEIK